MASRRRFSAAESAEIWSKWKSGYGTWEISKGLQRDQPVVHRFLLSRGGIAPVYRKRARIALKLNEREDISRGIVAGESIRQIARRLGRAASTVSREIKRHGGRHRYRASRAEEKAWRWGLRPKPCALAVNPALREVVASKLSLRWSPEQVSGWLKNQFRADESMRVSPETIYRSLFIQARGVLKKQLIQHLRFAPTMRRCKVARKDGRGQIPDAISIRERPAEVEDRAIPGHWEGDLILGSKRTYIATLVERHSRFTMLVKLPGCETLSVVAALTKHISKFPAQLRRSLTWDRGREMKQHHRLTLATDMKVYFCDPYSPWQRGTNENTNGLLRQYFPKYTDLSAYSQADLDKVALELNQRPRKTLGFETPADTLNRASVASTH